MEKVLDNIFKDFHKRYLDIFNRYYPAHNSTGFTERNLSHNYVSAVENEFCKKNDKKTLSWFEAPICLTTREHIDAIVFNEYYNLAMYIESKIFSNVSKKMQSIKRDINRIISEENIHLVEKELKDNFVKNRYAVILADIWTVSKSKIKTYENWPDCLETPNVYWHKKDGFEKLDTISTWKNDYKLLVAVIKINL